MNRFLCFAIAASAFACGGKFATDDSWQDIDGSADVGVIVVPDSGPIEIDATIGSDASASDANCNATPTLHPQEAGTLYCGNGADGGVLFCQIGEECCLSGKLPDGGFAPEECIPWGGTCTNGAVPRPIFCNQIADCIANGVANAASCCIQGAPPPTIKPGCTYPNVKGGYGTGVVCEQTAVCASGDVNICASQADCPSGTTCTAGKWTIFQFGYCM